MAILIGDTVEFAGQYRDAIGTFHGEVVAEDRGYFDVECLVFNQKVTFNVRKDKVRLTASTDPIEE